MSVDTLSLARELRAAHLASPQAEAIAAAIGRAVVETSATKADLAELRSASRADLLQVKTELEGKIDRSIEQLKSTLMMWFIGTAVTLGGIVIAAIKL